MKESWFYYFGLDFFIIGAVATVLWIILGNVDLSKWTPSALFGAWVAWTAFLGVPVGLVVRGFTKRGLERRAWMLRLLKAFLLALLVGGVIFNILCWILVGQIIIPTSIEVFFVLLFVYSTFGVLPVYIWWKVMDFLKKK